MKLSKFAHDLCLWSIIIAFVVLVVISVIVRDYDFIVTNTNGFLWELAAFSIIPPLLIAFVFFKTRKINIKNSITWFLLMVAKFAGFHMLFQLSGIYTVLFTL